MAASPCVCTHPGLVISCYLVISCDLLLGPLEQPTTTLGGLKLVRPLIPKTTVLRNSKSRANIKMTFHGSIGILETLRLEVKLEDNTVKNYILWSVSFYSLFTLMNIATSDFYTDPGAKMGVRVFDGVLTGIFMIEIAFKLFAFGMVLRISSSPVNKLVLLISLLLSLSNL